MNKVFIVTDQSMVKLGYVGKITDQLALRRNKITYELKESGKGKFKAEYEVYYNGAVTKEGDGQKLKVTIYPKETVEVTFTNTLEPPTKTGDEAPLAPYVGLGLASLTGLLYLFYRRRRTN